MCFPPMSLLKVAVGIGAVVSMIVSLALLGVTIFVNFEKKDIVDNTDKNTIDDLLVGLYIISIVFLVLAFCGVYGSIKARRRNSKVGNCLLSVYFIGVVVFLLVFVGTSIALFLAPGSIFGVNCEKGSKTQLIEQLFKLNRNANSGFCEQDCPCYINSTNTDSVLANWLTAQNRSFTDDPKTSFQNYQSCMNDSASQGSALLMSSLEQFLGCAGWCGDDRDEDYKFYKFTDINHCVTQDCMNSRQGCYDQFKDFTISKGKKMGVWSIIASAVCLINMVMICCICYHPAHRDRKRQNFYARMMQ